MRPIWDTAARQPNKAQTVHASSGRPALQHGLIGSMRSRALNIIGLYHLQKVMQSILDFQARKVGMEVSSCHYFREDMESVELWRRVSVPNVSAPKRAVIAYNKDKDKGRH